MIPNIGAQLAASLEAKSKRLNPIAAPIVAEDIKDKMLDNTSEGRAFGSDPYYPTYVPAYAKRRKIPPIAPQLSPVILRNKDLALETANVQSRPEGAEISFVKKGDIFLYHHTGQVKGGRTRSIFPKRFSSVPADTNNLAYKTALEVLRG